MTQHLSHTFLTWETNISTLTSTRGLESYFKQRKQPEVIYSWEEHYFFIFIFGAGQDLVMRSGLALN